MTVPLYVFEERYKALVKYCLEVEVPKFIITLAKPADVIRDGNHPFYTIGSFIHILQVSENPDGTYNLLGHGQERCKIDVLDEQQIAELDGTTRSLFLSRDRPFPLERGDPNLEKVAAWDALDTFREYAKVFFAFDALKQIEQVMPEEPLYQASFICANIRVPSESRQVLLEAPSLSLRFQLAQKFMQERLASHTPPKDI
jgi:ATP-dependent Lon protease